MTEMTEKAVTGAAILAAIFGAVVGFGSGLLLFESFLKACGLGMLLCGVFPVMVVFALALMQPWEGKK